MKRNAMRNAALRGKRRVQEKGQQFNSAWKRRYGKRRRRFQEQRFARRERKARKREREKEEGREGEPKGLPFTQSWPCDCLGPSTAQKPRRPKPCQVSTPPWWRWLPARRLVLTPGTLWNAPRGGIKEGRRLSWPPGPGLLTRCSLPAIQKHSKNYID